MNIQRKLSGFRANSMEISKTLSEIDVNELGDSSGKEEEEEEEGTDVTEEPEKEQEMEQEKDGGSNDEQPREEPAELEMEQEKDGGSNDEQPREEPTEPEMEEDKDGGGNEEQSPEQPAEQEKEVDKDGGSNDEQPAAAAPVEEEAPASDEIEEDDAGTDASDDDDNASVSSTESLHTALHRIGASPSFNLRTSSQVKPTEGVSKSPVVVESSVLGVSQQGALMRLNQMLVGEELTIEQALDMSIIENSSPEEFEQRIAELAESRGQTVDHAIFDSILDALLPLVKAKAQADELAEDLEDTIEEDEVPENTESGDGDTPDEELPTKGDSGEEEDWVQVQKEAEGKRESDSEQLPEASVNKSGEVSEDLSSDHTPEESEKAESEIGGGEPTPDTRNDAAEGADEGVGTQKIQAEAEEETQPSPVTPPAVDARPGDHEADSEDADSEDAESDEDDEEDSEKFREMSSALAALVQAADSRAAASEASTPSLGASGPSLPDRPLRSARPSLPSLQPAGRIAQQPRSSGVPPGRISRIAEPAPDGYEETREKLQEIKVKFLRLALRLGQPPQNVVVAQVLYRLGLAEQLRGGRNNGRNPAFSFDNASATAAEEEAAGPAELDFSCTIMLLGKTGVGKSATINSIFDEHKTGTNAFKPSTKNVQIITGHVHGIKVRVIDTPGLLPSLADQRHNEKVMGSVKRFIKNQAPDIVLYFDRLDMQSRDYGDLPLLRTITDTFGAAVWFNAIVVLTHASSAPPDGPNGQPLSYEVFVAQRSHVVQHAIRQAAGDMRLMNPVSLVENHPSCRMNRSRQRVLPNGQVWKPQLLLLCFASKILAEANSLLKLQDNNPGRPFGTRPRVPPLPYLLSSLLQSRAQLKFPEEQMGNDSESDEEEEDDEDSESDEDYDQLPPFRRLARDEIDELDEGTQGKYYEELAERERLFQRKQWKEELRRRKNLRRRLEEVSSDQQAQFADDRMEEEMERSAAIPVPMPDMALPPSFDSDNPSHRYRYLESSSQWLVRPVLETHGWDHDNGYDGMSVEKIFGIGKEIPASVSGTITKDKKESSMNIECAASMRHGEGKMTLAGLDIQTIVKDLAYTLRSETRFSNYKGNKTTGGLALTVLGDTISAGMKIEDRLMVGKRVKLVLNGGAITGSSDVAYGGSLEATLRDKDYPLSRTLSTLGVSVMDWHGDLAIGGNLQSQMLVGRTMVVGRANLNNRGAGQLSIRASSSEQIQMTLIGLIPVIRALANRLFGNHHHQ